MTTSSFIQRWCPVFLWAGLIFLLSSLPTLPSSTTFIWDYVLKKSAHITVYFILYLLTARAFHKPTSTKLTLAVIACIIYGITDEYHQSFVPGRTAKITDVGFDSLGIGIAYLRTYRFL